MVDIGRRFDRASKCLSDAPQSDVAEDRRLVMQVLFKHATEAMEQYIRLVNDTVNHPLENGSIEAQNPAKRSRKDRIEEERYGDRDGNEEESSLVKKLRRQLQSVIEFCGITSVPVRDGGFFEPFSMVSFLMSHVTM